MLAKFLDLLFSKDLVQFMDVSTRVEKRVVIEAAGDGVAESRAA